jgi:hypothetical protein
LEAVALGNFSTLPDTHVLHIEDVLRGKLFGRLRIVDACIPRT